ncbi:MAG: arginine--tRNA ligase [Proteobacteria bacterium]|nr:arginine--tRNA ligase [Pseudomonadota bacterium]
MNHQIDFFRFQLAELIHVHLTTMHGDIAFDLTIRDIAQLLEKPPESHLGDYSFPCFRFAKSLKLPPPKIAQILAESLNGNPQPLLKHTNHVNAFCNVFLNQLHLAKNCFPKISNKSFFTDPARLSTHRQNVMIEYSQPNTHKEFHVGHMRNVCLGSALVKLYRYFGHQVTAVNYFGDEGAHIAKCLWMLQKTGSKPLESDDKGAWLGTMYAKACIELDRLKDQDLKQAESEISNILAAIESKQGPTFELWKVTKEWSLKAFKDVYAWVGAEFDRDFYESEVSEQSQEIVNDLLKKGVFKEDQGAVGIDLSDHKLGFMLARKRDGNTLYATKDLVLAKRKFEEFKIDKSIYVVADEQNYHFKQVFKTLEIMGFPQAKDCIHLSYGMVVLPEGKMSSRLGNTIPFMQLKDAMMKEIAIILAKYVDTWSQTEIDEVCKKLCIGAIKYGMLSADPAREIVFSMKDWLSFEGNTGPYLMYGYTRATSILRKASEQNLSPLSIPELQELSELEIHDAERDVLRYLYDFNQAAFESCQHNRPSHICNHLYYMCKNFSRFYAEVPILKETDQKTLRFRLRLVASFAGTLHQGLGLLGITPPERM